MSDGPSCHDCRSSIGHEHAETCEVLARRLNRVASLRSLILGGTLQNAELVFLGPVTQ